MIQHVKLFSGPACFAIIVALLSAPFGFKPAAAIALTIWMALWWIFRPVSISVTALLPIVVNAFCCLVPNSVVISKYFSEIVILLLGADMICLTWTMTGLDKRLAVKSLCCIGTSMKQQILVWLGAATVLSIFLPNVVVAAILCPIAVSMLKFVGEKDVQHSRLAVPILLAIGWGSGVGGLGSPIGSSANLVAISYIEEMTGHEFMYVDWVTRFLPVLVLIFILNLLFLLHFKLPVQALPGARDYFQNMYKEYGTMKRGEKIGLTLFIGAAALAFLRPFFADLLPGLKPAYCFLILGMLMFVLKDEKGNAMLTWKHCESNSMWGMYFLFASGIALGQIILKTGAAERIADLIAKLPLTGGIGTMLVFVVFTTVMTEISSNTAAISISIPITSSICGAMDLNPIPYILAAIVSASCAYVLPVSTRAIPVTFGLNVETQLHEGIKLTLLNILLTTVISYTAMQLLPWFSHL